jgi:hypothetical protein
VGKPEIIGWTSDPDATEEERQHAALYEYGIDGEELYLRRNGSNVKHYKQSEDWDVWMRWLGMKRVYKPRNFRATPRSGGYLVYCEVCKINAYTDRHLPHDFAKIHAEKMHHYSTEWP